MEDVGLYLFKKAYINFVKVQTTDERILEKLKLDFTWGKLQIKLATHAIPNISFPR